MNPTDEVTLSLANRLRLALIHFFESEAGAAYYESTVMPIIREMCERGIATGSKQAIAMTGEFIVERGVIVWTTEKMTTTMILQRVGAETAEGIVKGANIFGFVLMLSQGASAETSSELKWEYGNYVKKYLNYLIKAGKRGSKHLRNMQPPMSYKQWSNRSGSGAWWQT